MKNAIELLRQLVEGLPAPTQTTKALLPQGKLRFLLEYPLSADLALEKSRLEKLLESTQFDFLPLPGDEDLATLNTRDEDDFGRFMVLQFPSLERTLSQRSLFDIAYAIQDQLQLISVEPDLGSRIYADPQAPDDESQAQTEGVVKDAITSRCWVEKPAPDNKRWAIEKMNIPAAWALSGKQGEGILIAQPDTGVAEHTELNSANLRLDLATNLVEGNDNPVDPLDSSTANPGHGTATSSVIISKEQDELTGAAPGAGLIPIRCIEDVKIFDAAPVIAAIHHARNVGSHVISMSLGGIPSRAMKKAIRRAVNNHMIVICAAGNCVDLVVWPARYDDVIGVGGSNIDDQPWRGSSFGDDVDISAPAELVWVARRNPDDATLNITEGGQGTSFATALTAGVAALWLAHHGRDILISIAQREQITLQTLFRKAIQSTATKPADWSTDRYGSGIINAEKLLQLQPDHIMSGQAPTSAPARHRSATDALLASLDRSEPLPTNAGRRSSGTTAEVNDNLSSHNTAGDFSRFELEISSNILETARLGTTENATGRVETTTTGFQFSNTLKVALESADDNSLLEPIKQVHEAPPAARVSQPVDTSGIQTLSRIPLNAKQDIDSAATASEAATRKSITQGSIKKLQDALEAKITGSPLSADTSESERQQLTGEVLQDLEIVLKDLKKGKEVEPENVRGNTALEALVKMEGRPAIRLTEEPIDLSLIHI